MQDFLLALPVLLFSMVAHEYAHGYAALRQGDDTAQSLGRLTLNPLKHIDPWMTVLLPVLIWFGSGGRFVFGGAKPVPVNPARYRDYRRGDIIVSGAGVAVNFALAVLCLVAAVLVGVAAGVTPGSGNALGLLQRMCYWGIWLNLLLAFFNLIPIPPLDGSHLLYHALPAGWRSGYRQLSRFGFLILLALLFFFRPVFALLLFPAVELYRLALRLASPFALLPPPLG